MTGTVTIKGLKVFAYHGCLPGERERGQDFLIDLELEYDITSAVSGDDLGRAVDYDRLVREVHDLATRERCCLIETLACRIAENVLESERVDRVLVRVHKPQAPLEHEVADVVVEVQLAKNG